MNKRKEIARWQVATTWPQLKNGRSVRTIDPELLFSHVPRVDVPGVTQTPGGWIKGKIEVKILKHLQPGLPGTGQPEIEVEGKPSYFFCRPKHRKVPITRPGDVEIFA